VRTNRIVEIKSFGGSGMRGHPPVLTEEVAMIEVRRISEGGRLDFEVQCQQRNDADADHQHNECNGITIQPVPIPCAHDAASPNNQPTCHSFPGHDGRRWHSPH
jgi:hypothetical protein